MSHTDLSCEKPGGVSLPGFLSLESRVVTPLGFTEAGLLREGDLVATSKQGFCPVTDVWQGEVVDGVVHLAVRGVGKPLTLAPRQAVWAIKGETKKCAAVGAKWDVLIGGGDRPQAIPADFISPGDYVHIPRQPGADALISEQLAWAYGLYLAEGSALVAGGASKLHYRVCMTMHERELTILQRFAEVLSVELGMANYRVGLRKRVNYTSEYTHAGRDYANHFRELFGHGAAGKKMPAWFHVLTPVLKRAVVQGWIDGDGHTAYKAGYTQTSATTISPVLAMQMYQLALSAGLRPSSASLAPGGRRKNESHTIHFNAGQESLEVEGQLYYRVNGRYRSGAATTMVGLAVAVASSVVVEHVSVIL